MKKEINRHDGLGHGIGGGRANLSPDMIPYQSPPQFETFKSSDGGNM